MLQRRRVCLGVDEKMTVLLTAIYSLSQDVFVASTISFGVASIQYKAHFVNNSPIKHKIGCTVGAWLAFTYWSSI